MHHHFKITVLLTLGLLLSACADRPNTLMKEPIVMETKSDASGTVTDSPNERTPATVDSLEVPAASSGAMLQTSISGSGTIITGNPENRHRLIVFADEDCLYCRHFITGDLPWILQDMVAGDKLAIERVFLPMSATGENAAKLAVCAAEQKKFPEADAWLSSHDMSAIDLKKFANAVGLNVKKLAACTARKDLLAGNLRKAKENGVERVPFFVLGSDSWLGLMTKEELKERLEFNLR